MCCLAANNNSCCLMWCTSACQCLNVVELSGFRVLIVLCISSTCKAVAVASTAVPITPGAVCHSSRLATAACASFSNALAILHITCTHTHGPGGLLSFGAANSKEAVQHHRMKQLAPLHGWCWCQWRSLLYARMCRRQQQHPLNGAAALSNNIPRFCVLWRLERC